MKTFRGAALLAVRCSTAMGFLLVPSYLVSQNRGQLTDGKPQLNPFSLASSKPQNPSGNLFQPTTTTTTTEPFAFNSPSSRGTNLNLPLPISSTTLWQSSSDSTSTEMRKDDDFNKSSNTTGNNMKTQVKEGKIRYLKRRTVEKIKALFQKGKSVLSSVRSRERTEMEAALLENPISSAFAPEISNSTEEVVVEVEEVASTKQQKATDLKEDTSSTDTSTTSAQDLPVGPRWATAHPGTDLSGNWKPIITPAFKEKYDQYLQACGSNYMFRKLCLNFVVTTREMIDQNDKGRILTMTGVSPAGEWERSLISSGTDCAKDDFETVYTEFVDPDKEKVKVEAYWAYEGKVHTSYLREKASLCGGELESLRYLETAEDGIVELVCESTFKPGAADLEKPGSKLKAASIQWRYRQV